MNNSLTDKKERFDMLPEDTQKAIRSFDYDKALRDIHTKYNLHIDQAGALEQAVADVIFGATKPYDLIKRIGDDLRIDPEKAQEIAFDINTNILREIQELMKKVQAEQV